MKSFYSQYSRFRKSSDFILALCFFLLFINQAFARYDFNQNCIKAYKEIIALNFESGRVILEKEKILNPLNKIPVTLENYIDFLTLSIGEERSDFEALISNRALRINQLSLDEAESPWRRHCLAVVYLQWSFVRVKFGEYFMAGFDLNRVRRLLEENKLYYPEFIPDLLLSGVMNALIGSIPENYNWVIRLAGMEGTIDSGRANLYKLIDIADADPQWVHLKSEAFFYLSFIEMNLQSDKNRVAELLQRMKTSSDLASGPLNCYIKANLCMRIGKNDSAVDILENCDIPNGSYPFHYLEFVLGVSKLKRLDNNAKVHFNNYVNRYKGKNYIKSAYQHLAWISLLQNDKNEYRFYISQIQRHGQAFVDEDKQAQAEASSNQLPNVRLLKARLLFDGGYYDTALYVLETGLTHSDLPLFKDTVEYYYRMARIYHEWGKTQPAIKYYLQTIEKGSQLPYFFAGNSALQLGYIYENMENYSLAWYYFDLCLKLRFTEYKTSIHQKASAGRNRVSAKQKSRLN